MHYQLLKPNANLRHLIRFFWVFEADLTESNPYEHTYTASVFPKLAFQYRGVMHLQQPATLPEAAFTCGFQAQSNQAGLMRTQQKAGIFGVYFFPQAIPILFSIPASAITNYHISLTDLLGKPGEELEEKMLTAKSTAERLQIITAFLEKQLVQSTLSYSPTLNTIHYILNRQGLINIEQFAADNFLSTRQFERKFKNYTGFSPKLFSRIVRFEHSISAYLNSNLSLTEVAYACGYYDQSHFIKDFREFSGQHPSAYFRADLSMFRTSG